MIKKTLDGAEAGDVESMRLFYENLMPRLRFVPATVAPPLVNDLVEARMQIAKLANLALQKARSTWTA